MKYIASCSFGKDSLAMLIKIKELGMPLDEVIYCEIMFDEEISGETPEMYEFIKKAEKVLKEKFNIEVKHLRGVSFKEQFYRVKKRGKHIGDNYGFPYVVGAWCNSRLKIEPIRSYLKGIQDDVIQYVGIAYDEPQRYERLNHSTHIAPLYDLKITENEALEICKKYDLVSPIYQSSFRGGCWFCVKQSINQLRNLFNYHNELWRKLIELEKDSFNTFKPNLSLKELETRFKKETSQLTIFDFIESE
jgi:3'-phosphoadenosine 5'-phosphosulfate sulfotransferase (PAPS reductase)/FAD synthetase